MKLFCNLQFDSAAWGSWLHFSVPDPESELIDLMSQTECEQNYLHIEEPYRNWPSGIQRWKELWHLIAVIDRGSWLRVAGSDCFVLYALYCRNKEHFLIWFFESIKICSSSASECPPHFWYHIGIKSSSMQFWSRFSKDAFALGMGTLVCFTAPHCLRTSLSWSRKDSCCSPSRLHCACPCTITALSWRRSLFGKSKEWLAPGCGGAWGGSLRVDCSSSVTGAKGSAISSLPASSGSPSLT